MNTQAGRASTSIYHLLLTIHPPGGGGGASGSVTPCMASQSSVGTISMASHGQPSRNAPSGPLLMHFWQPMQRYGSTSMRPKGEWSSSGTQNMHASMGQYSMHAGEPAQPVQQSVVMARMRGFFLRVALPSPTDMGQCFSTIPIMRHSGGQVSEKTQTL